jgi:hypothetical protein
LNIKRLKEYNLDKQNICLIRLCEKKKKDLKKSREDVLLLLYYTLIKRLLRVYIIKCLFIGKERAILYIAKRDRYS